MNDRSIRLARAAAKGDQTAYGVLVRDHSGLVYSMAFRMTADHHLAEDLYQEIFTKAWMQLPKLKRPEAFSGWVAAIARRTCLTAIEKRRRAREVPDEDHAEPSVQPEMPPAFDPARVVQEEAIARLRLRDRELITLSYFEDLSSAEVAEIMGLEPGTVRVYLMRAREKLKALLKGREHELFEQ